MGKSLDSANALASPWQTRVRQFNGVLGRHHGLMTLSSRLFRPAGPLGSTAPRSTKVPLQSARILRLFVSLANATSMPLVNLDYQNFWEPPSVKGPSHGHRAKQPSPPKRRQPGSSDSNTEQGSWLKVENSCTESFAIQGQTKDEPIIIASDAESENEAEDETLYDADGGIIPPASSPPSDDTLPSLEHLIVASTAKMGCDDILMNGKLPRQCSHRNKRLMSICDREP